MLKPGGIDDYRLCTSIKNIFKIFYFGPKSTPIQPLNGIVEKSGGGGIKTRGRNFGEDTFKLGLVGQIWNIV